MVSFWSLLTCLDGETLEGSKEVPDMDKLAKLSSDAKFSHGDILAASAALKWKITQKSSIYQKRDTKKAHFRNNWIHNNVGLEPEKVENHWCSAFGHDYI